MGSDRLLRHATRMAFITFGSRVTGYVRDKMLAWALGAGELQDAFRTAFRIPNAFRALLAEGALHAAFVPMLTHLEGESEAGERARDLVRGLVAAMLAVLAVVVAAGVLASPWLVALYGKGFAATPGKLEVTVLMNRLMFPYLGLISLAALCQGVLNSRERFLLPAATPILLNLVLAGAAWWLARDLEHAPVVLSAAVLVGGMMQLAVQMPAVRALGYSLRPAWRLARSADVRQVLLLMLPGIPVLGINQLNQLLTNRFASHLGEGAVTATFYAYRVTELMFGGLVVQLTTVLLPVLARELRAEPDRASATLLDTVRLVTFVTLPSATALAFAGGPIIGLLFGGGAFSPQDVAVTGATLTAYAFSLVGTGQAKVMASAFFAHRDTRSPMWGSAAALVVFAVGCVLLAPVLGVAGLGWANTAAMGAYALLLTWLYARRHGLGSTSVGPTGWAVLRQLIGSGAAAGVLLMFHGSMAEIARTGMTEALRVGLVLVAAGGTYVAVVWVLGGREPAELIAAVRRRRAV